MPDKSHERRAILRETRVLRAVFLAGAVTDAVALLPMLLPSFATLLWACGADVVPAGHPARPLCMGVLRRTSGIARAAGPAMKRTALASNEFSRDIPPLVTYGENTLRIVVMVLPFLIPLEVTTGGQRRGLLLLAVGTVFYMLAWVPLMIAPESPGSTSCSWLGFVAPAYTPIVWLTGLGLVGRRLYVPSPYRRWMYVALACGFVAFHVTHTSIVYAQNYPHQAVAGGEGR